MRLLPTSFSWNEGILGKNNWVGIVGSQDSPIEIKVTNKYKYW